MSDLEKLLENILPQEKKKRSPSKLKDIDKYLRGKYITKHVFLYKNEYPLDNEIKRFEVHSLIKKYTNVENIEIDKLLFIDTETTGLAGGAGTYVFLIGLGYFSRSSFIIKQYFLTDLTGEKELLKIFREEIKRHQNFVTYNGKSYDIPLLRARSIFLKMRIDLSKMGNIDLLHLSRRFWRDKLEEFTLQNIERQILNVKRKEGFDISGSAIPDAYFDYLETRNAKFMKNIIYHNQKDILSLVLIMEQMNTLLYKLPKDLAKEKLNYFEIGRLYLLYGDKEKAIQIFEDILSKDKCHAGALKKLSFIYKRAGNYRRAVELWEIGAENDQIYAHKELAKWEEHTNKDYKKALAWTLKAIQIQEISPFVKIKVIKELSHREKRLRSKL